MIVLLYVCYQVMTSITNMSSRDIMDTIMRYHKVSLVKTQKIGQILQYKIATKAPSLVSYPDQILAHWFTLIQ